MRSKVTLARSEPKSVRTVRLLSQLKHIEMPKDEASHNALEDCIRQAKEISTYIQKVGA